MVYRAISEDLKVHALYLLEQGYITEEVCELLGVSRRSLYRWKANQLDYGGVIPPTNPFRGRPRILNADQTHDLLTLLAEAPEMYLDEIMDWVALYLDAAISRTALHMLINDAGLTYKILRRAASERDEEVREQWRQLIWTNFVASMIVTADESSKDERTIFRKRGRAPSRHRGETDANLCAVVVTASWLQSLSTDTLGCELSQDLSTAMNSSILS
jgi:transposase